MALKSLITECQRYAPCFEQVSTRDAVLTTTLRRLSECALELLTSHVSARRRSPSLNDVSDSCAVQSLRPLGLEHTRRSAFELLR